MSNLYHQRVAAELVRERRKHAAIICAAMNEVIRLDAAINEQMDYLSHGARQIIDQELQQQDTVIADAVVGTVVIEKPYEEGDLE